MEWLVMHSSALSIALNAGLAKAEHTHTDVRCRPEPQYLEPAFI